MRVGRLIFCVVLATILIVPLTWGCLTAFEPEVLLYQAQRIAGERPYCIVAADADHPLRYKAIKNRSDLAFNALVTHMFSGGSRGPFAGTYYSLLILKDPNEVRNWSKRYLNFESDVIPMQSSIYRTDLAKLCTPIVNFAKLVP